MGDITERVQTQNIWGQFWKSLNAQQQKQYVLNSVRQLYNKHPECEGDNVKVNDVLSNLKYSNSGERRYVLSYDWWNQWCDYVNLDTEMLVKDIPDSIDCQLQEDNYSAPLKINNSNLIKDKYTKALQPNLVEGLDYW